MEKPSIEDVKKLKLRSTGEETRRKDYQKEVKQSAPREVSTGSSVLQKANPNQKLSPAVELLLHENNISNEDAFAKIKLQDQKGEF